MQGAPHVLRHHSGRISQALSDLFPEIGLVKSKFYLQRKLYFKNIGERSFRKAEFIGDFRGWLFYKGTEKRRFSRVRAGFSNNHFLFHFSLV